MRYLLIACLLMAGCAETSMVPTIKRYYDIEIYLRDEKDPAKRQALERERQELGFKLREWDARTPHYTSPMSPPVACRVMPGGVVVCG